MVLSIFLSMIYIFNNIYVIILCRKISKISIFISTYLLVCRHCISNQWIAEEIDKKKSPFLFLMNPEFHNKRTVKKWWKLYQIVSDWKGRNSNPEIAYHKPHRYHPSPRHFDGRSEVEKSHADVGRAPWWQKISRLSVSIVSKAFTPMPAGPPLEMTIASGSLSSYDDKPKGAVKKW